jgi:hypothetical protein
MLRKIVLLAFVLAVLIGSSPTYAAEEAASPASITSLWENFWGWLGDWLKSTGTEPSSPPAPGETGGSGLDPNGFSEPSTEGGGWLDPTGVGEDNDTGSMVDPDG